jgi:hypothetical protein
MNIMRILCLKRVPYIMIWFLILKQTLIEVRSITHCLQRSKGEESFDVLFACFEHEIIFFLQLFWLLFISVRHKKLKNIVRHCFQLIIKKIFSLLIFQNRYHSLLEKALIYFINYFQCYEFLNAVKQGLSHAICPSIQ